VRAGPSALSSARSTWLTFRLTGRNGADIGRRGVLAAPNEARGRGSGKMPWTLKIRVNSIGPGSIQSKGIAALGGLDQRRAATGCGQAVLLSPPLKIGSEHHMSEQWGQATAEPSRCDCWLAGQATASRRTIAGLSISANRTPRHAARGGCVPPAPLGTAVSSRRECLLSGINFSTAGSGIGCMYTGRVWRSAPPKWLRQ
jgi:hypothetical protein